MGDSLLLLFWSDFDNVTFMTRKVAVIQADITDLGVDVIVNAANEGMRGGGGVDGAIRRVAGPEMADATIKAAPLYVAKTFVTPGYNLKSRYVVHTVGPRYGRGDSGEYIALEMCYRNVISAANDLGARTMAIPAISAGVYGFPQERAAKIAVETSLDESRKYDGIEEVLLVAFDRRAFDLYKKYLAETA